MDGAKKAGGAESALSFRRNGNFANRADDTNVNSTQLI